MWQENKQRMSERKIQIGRYVRDTDCDKNELLGADRLFIRADLMPRGKFPELLKGKFPGKAVYVLRSQREGGEDKSSVADRHALLIRAATCFDFVELEGETDLVPELLKKIPAPKRIISWQGPSESYSQLNARMERYIKHEASAYLIVPRAEKAGDELAALELLRKAGRHDLITYSDGPIGLWTHVAAAFFGSPFILATDAGEGFTVRKLVEDYALPAIYQVEKIYGIAGNPVSGSLSPRMHNFAYRDQKLPALYLPFHVDDYQEFWTLVRSGKIEETLGIEVNGFTTVSPFKEAAYFSASTCIDPHATTARASNLAIRKNGNWVAGATDGLGTIRGLREFGIPIKGSQVAIVGCGGAGRTIAARLKTLGAKICMYNRSRKRGEYAAEILAIPFRLLSDFVPGNYDIVVHATPSGKKQREQPFDTQQMRKDAVLVDLIYRKTTTPLVRSGSLRGLRIIDGKQILVNQVREQYHAMTGREMPREMAMEVASLDRVVKIDRK